MRKLFAVAAIALALLSGGWTTHVIRDRPGGIIVAHIAEFWNWYQNGDHVVIDGDCDSACTVVIGIVPDDKICTTKRGYLGFHSAFAINLKTGSTKYDQDGTNMLWFFYDKDVRKVLAKHGWPGPKEHPKIIDVKATEILPLCKDSSE